MLLKSWHGILVILNIEKPCAETEGMTLLFTTKARFESSYIDAAIRSKRRPFTKNFSDPLVVSIRSTSASEAQALHTFKVEHLCTKDTISVGIMTPSLDKFPSDDKDDRRRLRLWKLQSAEQ